MSEADRRRQDYRRYEAKVVGLGAERGSLVEQLSQAHKAFLKKYGSTGLSEDLAKLLILAAQTQRADTDVDWVNSFNTVPGVTAAMADQFLDAKRAQATNGPTSPPTQKPTVAENSLESLLEPGDPDTELAGRFEENLRVTEHEAAELAVSRAILDPMLPDDETRETVDELIVDAQRLAIGKEGLIWVRVLNRHPWFASVKITEIWNGVDQEHEQKED